MDGYSGVWFNTPSNLRFALAPAQITQRLQKFGIKPDGIINFLSNEPPIRKLLYVPDTAGLALRRLIRSRVEYPRTRLSAGELQGGESYVRPADKKT
jgi:hypothetical protein